MKVYFSDLITICQFYSGWSHTYADLLLGSHVYIFCEGFLVCADMYVVVVNGKRVHMLICFMKVTYICYGLQYHLLMRFDHLCSDCY